MKQWFIKHCKLYRKLIHKRFGLPDVPAVYIPSGILSNEKICYLSYDEQGRVHEGFTSLKAAIQSKGKFGISVLY